MRLEAARLLDQNLGSLQVGLHVRPRVGVRQGAGRGRRAGHTQCAPNAAPLRIGALAILFLASWSLVLSTHRRLSFHLP